MTSQTPRTDAAERQSHHPYNIVKSNRCSFSRELELENVVMRNAITSAVELLDGLDLQLKGNYGMFLLTALDKLQPFLK